MGSIFIVFLEDPYDELNQWSFITCVSRDDKVVETIENQSKRRGREITDYYWLDLFHIYKYAIININTENGKTWSSDHVKHLSGHDFVKAIN